MKSYKYIIAAAAILSTAACSKSELQITPEPQEDAKMVQVTLGADFAATKTSMASDGKVLWSTNDTIKVQVGQNAYDFELTSGVGTQTATFTGVVSEDDAAVIKGTAAGTVSAFYPTSGTSVPATQTWAENTFADNTFPMTASFTGPTDTPTLSFSTNAAVVRVQNVAASATSAVLSYTVGSTDYTVTMALTAGSSAKDLYFVVVPGAKDFTLSIDGAIAVSYKASAVTAAGSRYSLNPAPVAKIGETTYATLTDAVYAVPATGEETTIQMIANHNVGEFTGNKFVIPSTAKVVLDLNGKTISATGNGGVASYLFYNKGDLKIIDTAGDGTITYSSTTPDGSYGYGTSTILNRGILEAASGNIVNTTSGGASYAVDNQTLWWDEIIPVEFTLSGTANLECTTGDAGLRQAIACGGYSKGGQPIINNVNIEGGTITGDIWIQVLNTGSVGNLSITGGTITGPVYNTSGDVSNITYSISGGVFQGTHQTRGSISLQGKSGFITGGKFSTEPTASYIASGYKAEQDGSVWNVVENQGTSVTSVDDLNNKLTAIAEAGDYIYVLPAGTISGNTIRIRQLSGVNVTLKGTSGGTTLKNTNIQIDGMSLGPYTSESVTIKGITFDYSEYGENADIIASFKFMEYGGNSVHTRNVTIDSCTFTGNPDKDIVAVRTPTGQDACYNFTIRNCTGTNLHSLGQFESTKGLTITGCTLDCGRGVNLQGSQNVVISGNTWTISDYVIRAGQSKDAGANNTTLKIYGNTFTKTSENDDGCLVLRYDCPTDITFCDNTITYTYDPGNKYDVVNKGNLGAATTVKTDKTDITSNSLSNLTITQGTWDKSTKTFTPGGN